MSSMYDKLEGLAQAAGTQAGPGADGDALIGRVRRTRSVFRVGSAGVVGVAGLGLLFGGVAFASAATGGLANTIVPGASISPSPSAAPSAAPSVSPSAAPSASPTLEPSPDPTWGTTPGSKDDDCNDADDQGKDDDCNDADDQGEDADHQAGGDDSPDATDDSHHTDGTSTTPNPEPSEASGDHNDD